MDDFTRWRVRQIEEELKRLEAMGAEVAPLRSKLRSGKVREAGYLESLTSEVLTYKLLFTAFRDGLVPGESVNLPRVDFVWREGGMAFEVFTPMLPESFRFFNSTLKLIERDFRDGQFYQVFYDPLRGFKTALAWEIPGRTVRTGGEILIANEIFQPEIAAKIGRETRRRRGKFKRSGLKGFIVVDVSRSPLVNPRLLVKLIQSLFTEKDKCIAGVLLLTQVPAGRETRDVFVAIPNPLCDEDLPEELKPVIARSPPHTPYTYALPLALRFRRADDVASFSMERGVIVCDGRPVAPSIAFNREAGSALSFIGLLGSPRNLRKLELKVLGSSAEVVERLEVPFS